VGSPKYLRGRWFIRITQCIVAGAIASLLLPAAQAPQQPEQQLSKQERRRQKAIQKEMEGAYSKWIEEEVPYIITPEERTAWKKLSTDDEREQFIEAFWERRNPSPGSPENEFKEEYYRRIAYANEHYASGIPGWKTDRGRIYILWGPPDEIDQHAAGGAYTMDPNEMPAGPTSMGSGYSNQMTTFPFERWRYRYIEGIGTNVELEFVDPTMTGEYHLTMNPCEKDAMAMTPNDMTGCQGGVSIGPMWNPNLVFNPNLDKSGYNRNQGPGADASMSSTNLNEFDRLDLYAKIFQPPPIKFKDLQAVVTSRLSAQLLPFDVRTDFIRVTEETVLTPVTLQVANRDLEFQNKGGVMHAVLDIFIQATSLSGRIVNTNEKSLVVDVPEREFGGYVDRRSVYQEVLPLRPGRYKLTLVLKDDINGHMGSMELGVVVPRFEEDKLANSSLILADLIQPLPTTQVGSGPFVIGGTKVRPSVNQSFTQDQKLGIYMQVYNLGLDATTHKPSVSVQYEILKDGKAILDQPEDPATLKSASQELTIKKTLPLASLAPGKYTVQIKVTDNIKKATVSPSTSFVLH
jgi:GWxTD domain-containing protein